MRLPVAVFVLFAAGVASAQSFVPAGGTLYNVPVKSLVEMRFESVVRQEQDLSCGAAALATLLRHYYHEEIDEQVIIDGISEFGDSEKIAREGFSMLELKRYAEQRGYMVQGFRVENVSALREVKLPFIALLQIGSYRHFVVVRGIDQEVVFIADPAFGNLRTEIEGFAKAWQKTAFFVVDPALNAEIASTGAIPDSARAQTMAFVDQGRVVPARPQDVNTLTDYGFRPMQPTAGSFR